jgi:hypothetical protein
MTGAASLLDWGQYDQDREPAPAVERVQYPRDVELRRAYLPYGNHGARINLHFLTDLVRRYVSPGDVVLDPMAGIGSLAYGLAAGLLPVPPVSGILVELEEQHAVAAAQNARHNDPAGHPVLWRRCSVLQGSADQLPLDNGAVDVVLFSPPYFDAATRKRHQDPNTQTNPNVPAWRRHRTDAGLHVDSYGGHPRQVGNMDYPRHRIFMRAIYGESYRVLRPGGRLVVVTADIYRGNRRQDLRGLTRLLCEGAGFTFREHWQRDRTNAMTWPQNNRRKRGEPFVGEEDVQVFSRDGNRDQGTAR